MTEYEENQLKLIEEHIAETLLPWLIDKNKESNIIDKENLIKTVMKKFTKYGKGNNTSEDITYYTGDMEFKLNINDTTLRDHLKELVVKEIQGLNDVVSYTNELENKERNEKEKCIKFAQNFIHSKLEKYPLISLKDINITSISDKVLKEADLMNFKSIKRVTHEEQTYTIFDIEDEELEKLFKNYLDAYIEQLNTTKIHEQNREEKKACSNNILQELLSYKSADIATLLKSFDLSDEKVIYNISEKYSSSFLTENLSNEERTTRIKELLNDYIDELSKIYTCSKDIPHRIRKYTLALINKTRSSNNRPFTISTDKCVDFILNNLKQPYKATLNDMDGLPQYCIDGVEQLSFNENDRTHCSQVEKYYKMYIYQLQREDLKSDDSRIICNQISKALSLFVPTGKRILEESVFTIETLHSDTCLKLEEFLHIWQIITDKLSDDKYKTFLNNPDYFKEEHYLIYLLLQKFNKIIKSNYVVDETYTGKYLGSNCLVPYYNYSPVILYLNYLGVTFYKEKNKVKCKMSEHGDIEDTTIPRLNERIELTFEINKLLESLQYKNSSSDENYQIQKQIYFDPSIQDIKITSKNIVLFNNKVFSPYVNAKYYFDSKSREYIINTYEDISHPEFVKTSNTAFPTLKKVIEYTLKYNSTAIDKLYEILSSYVRYKIAPDFWLVFFVSDIFGQSINFLYRVIFLPIFLQVQCKKIDGIELYDSLDKDLKDKLVNYIEDIPTGITQIQQKKLNNNIKKLVHEQEDYNLKIIKTTETASLKIKDDPNSFCLIDSEVDFKGTNYFGLGSEKKLGKVCLEEIPAFFKYLSTFNKVKTPTEIEPLDDEFKQYILTIGNRVDIHIEAYLTKNIKVFEPLLNSSNPKDRELLLEIKKCFNYKKPYVSQQLITKVWCALEKDNTSSKDVLAKFFATEPNFFKAENSQKMTNSDVRYWIRSVYNRFYEGEVLDVTGKKR